MKNINLQRTVLTFVTVLLLFGVALASDLPRIRELIFSIPALPPVVDRDNVQQMPAVTEDYFGVPSTRQDTQHQLTRSFEDIVAFTADPTLIWPGSVLQGRPLSEGGFIGVTLPRAPGVLTISNLQFTEPANYTASLARPSQGTTEAAIRRLIQQPQSGVQAARISFARSELFSLDQGLLSVGVNAKWLTGSLRSSLQQEVTRNRSSYVIRFMQAYYDVSFERPTEPEGFFAPTATLTTARTQMGPDNPPVYISTVTYGRILLVFFSANESSEKLVASIDAAYSAGFGNLETRLSTEQLNILRQSHITVLALGGASGAVTDILTGDKIGGLQTYLGSGANFSLSSPAHPISYQVKHLRDGSLAKLGYTTNYVAQVYSPIPAIRQVLVHFQTHGDDKDPDESVEMWVLDGSWTQVPCPPGTHPFICRILRPHLPWQPNGPLIANQRWGQGQKWDNHTPQDFVLNLNPAVLLSRCPNLRFRLRKHPDSDTGSGWRMSLQLKGLLFNGRTVLLKEWGERLVGDGNQYDFVNESFFCSH